MAKSPVSPQKINLARGLRHWQTDAERIMWNRLRNLQMDGAKFRRHHPIGDYIVDFVSLDEPLAKVILNEVKNLGWGIASYLVDHPPQTLRFAQGDIVGAFCKRF